MGNKILTAVIALVALFIGAGIGAAGATAPTTAATPRPAVTVTAKPVVRTKTVTKTETVVKKATPPVCLDALNDADALSQVSADMAGVVRGHLQMDAAIWNGLADGDTSELAAGPGKIAVFNGEIRALTDRVTASTYPANRDACRALS